MYFSINYSILVTLFPNIAICIFLKMFYFFFLNLIKSVFVIEKKNASLKCSVKLFNSNRILTIFTKISSLE